MSDALTAAIAEIRSVTAASAEACEGDRWTGHDFTEEQDAHFPGPTDDAIAEILNAVIDGRLAPRLSDASVEVKPLEWEQGVVDWARPLPGMKYVACSSDPHPHWSWWNDCLEGPVSHNLCESEAAAKAAAQADYDQRIRSALTTRTVEDVRREAFEEAAQYHDNFLMTQTEVDVEKVVSSTEEIRAMGETPAPSRETQPSPDPVAWREWARKLSESLSVQVAQHGSRNAKRLLCDYRDFCAHAPDATPQPDELRQAKAEAWNEGHKAKVFGLWQNPYAAPDEGGGK